MKKIVITIFFIFFLVLGYFEWNWFQKKELKNPFLEKEYTEEEIIKIESLRKENQEYLQKEAYQTNLFSFLNHKEFKEEKMKDYLSFYQLYGLSVDDTIFIVDHNYQDQTSYTNETIALMRSPYYIHENLERYLAYAIPYTVSENKVEYQITAVNSNLDYPYYEHDIDVNLSQNYQILVNKYHKLSSNYVPQNMVSIDSKYGVNQKLEKTVYEQYIKMWESAKKEGLILYINSPYRSYQTQQNLYNRYVNRDGKVAADTYSARPGYSEHQTGLAFDVTSKTTNFDNFEQSNEFKWMQAHAHEYGFILRYPKGKEWITGYIYEPWHYRYVGVEVATKVYETGLTYEEYYAYYVR